MSDTELSKGYEPAEVEGRWYPYWMERGYFRAEATSDKPPFSIVIPPPNVTGSLHLGHALTATIQDILTRWMRMSGYNALWLPGTDHAGIATQMVVERELKKTEGKSRHDLGRGPFIERVWEWKTKYGSRITEQQQKLGASLDWDRERFTMDEGLSKAVREVFVRLYEEGLIYRANKLINWCPSCHTALSDLEVEHEEKQGSLWHIKYPVTGSERTLTVATTRPETMLGDTAVAVHPDDPRYQGLVGRTVTLPLVDREIPIVADPELVNMEFGTGVVKVTPAHDHNDYQTGLRHNLPMISIFDDSARTNREAGPYAGLDRYDARKRVLADLQERGLLEKEEPHKLAVGGCQRCGTVVEPRLSPQWFVKIEPLARPAIEAVEQGRTKFVPESWTDTYFHWMRNIHDWCISRQLWWGHQIPAWYCKTCSPRQGDDTDLPLDAPTQQVGAIDFERAKPLVQREAPTTCPRCGGHSFLQDPDVLDTWFSSALWPFSTLGWPEQTTELKTFYPTSVMETGHDILFFWVARMMMMGIHFMGEVPFKTVYLHAMVRDEKGEKMSKTKGNVIDPLDVIFGQEAKNLPPAVRNKFPQGMPAFGADALRFTLASLTQQGRDIKLSLDRVNGYKAFANKIWNAARFALMNLGEFKLDARPITERELSLADRWILSRLFRATDATVKALVEFQFAEAASTIYQFIWRELADWYIELSKISLYGDDEQAKDNTRAVLVFALDQTLRLLHPFMPFITEEIWQKLPLERQTDSIMIAAYPDLDARLKDEAAEAEMAPVVAAIEGLRTIRGESNLAPATKVEAIIQSADPNVRATLERWGHYLRPLAGLSSLRISPPGPKPSQAAAHVEGALELFVPLAGLIDLEEERKRLEKEISRTEQELQGIARKLDNPNFVAKAPPDVVEKDRARVAELEAKRQKLKDNLSRIQPGESNVSQSQSDEKKPEEPQEQVSQSIPNPESAQVKVAAPVESGSVDLASELKGDLEQVSVPEQVDPQVKTALEKLREGTKEGLSSKDHYDLGVAYMGMGLVDDAVHEFNQAKKDDAPASTSAGMDEPKVVAKRTPKKVAAKRPAKKAAPAKAAVKKVAAKAKAKAPVKQKVAVKRKAAKPTKKLTAAVKSGARTLKGAVAKANGSRRAVKAKAIAKKAVTRVKATQKKVKKSAAGRRR